MLPVEQDFNLVTANKARISILGYVDVSVILQGLHIPFYLYVLHDLSHSVIFGNDFMRECKAEISYSQRTISLFDGLVTAPLTMRHDEQAIAILANDIIIPPLTEVLTKVVIPKKHRHTTCLLETYEPLKNKYVLVAGAVIEPDSEFSICRLCNVSKYSRTLRRNQPIASISRLDVNEPLNRAMLLPHQVDNTVTEEISQLSFEDKLKQLQQIGLMLNNENLSKEQKMQLVDLLFKYREIFCSEYENLPVSKLPPVHIEMKEPTVIRQKQYPLPFQSEIILEKFTDRLLAAGIVENSNSPFNSPAIIIKKKCFDPKNPSNLNGFRMCIDYRKINPLISNEFQPLMTGDSIFNQIATAKPLYFSTWDFTAGFYQVILDKESRPLTAYSTKTRHVQFTRTPMGLRSSPAQFLSNIYSLFRQEMRSNLVIYMDDGILFSKTFTEHLTLLENIFKKLKNANLRINPGKSAFAKSKLNFLAFEFSEQGMKIDSSRFDKIRDIKPAKSVKELRGILGFFTYFKKYCPNFSALTAPWRELLKSDTKFEWSEQQDIVLAKLKEILLQNAVLHYPQMEDTFYLQTDASKFGIGFSLWQKQGKDFKPVSFGGRSLKKHESTLSSTDSELLAVLSGISAYRTYLTGPKEFVILSDNISLKYIKNLKHSSSPKLVRYAMLLQTLNFRVEHVEGKLNVAMDFISRNPTGNEKTDSQETDELLDVAHYDYLNAIDVEELLVENKISEKHRSFKKRKFTMCTLTPIKFNKKSTNHENSQESDVEEAETNTEDTAANIQSTNENQQQNELRKKDEEIQNEINSKFAGLINLQTQAEGDSFNEAMIHYLQKGELPNKRELAKQIIFQEQEYFIKNNQLFHLGRLGKKFRLKTLIKRYEQLVVPGAFKLNILKEFHDQAHFSHVKSYLSARKRFYWRGACIDHYEYASSCETCLQIKTSKNSQFIRHPLPVSPVLFECVQLDFHSILMNKREQSQQEYKHVLVIIEQNSQFVELFPTKDQKAETVAQKLFEYILRFGCFKKLITDRSSSFLNQTFQALLKLPGMQILHMKTSSYYPKCNGLTERVNRDVIRMIRAGCEDKMKFHECLPTIASAINSMHNIHLGASPFFILFGQDFRTPVDTVLGAEIPTIRQTNLPEGLHSIAEQLQLLRKLTHTQVTESRELARQKNDEKAVENKFKIGDKVYLNQIFDHGLQNAKHSKIYTGPWAIVDMHNSILARLQHFHSGKLLKNWVNVQHLRASRDERRERFLNKLNKTDPAQNGVDDLALPQNTAITSLTPAAGQTTQPSKQLLQHTHAKAPRYTSCFSLELHPQTPGNLLELAQEKRPAQGNCVTTSIQPKLPTASVGSKANQVVSTEQGRTDWWLPTNNQPVEDIHITPHQSLSNSDSLSPATGTSQDAMQPTPAAGISQSHSCSNCEQTKDVTTLAAQINQLVHTLKHTHMPQSRTNCLQTQTTVAQPTRPSCITTDLIALPQQPGTVMEPLFKIMATKDINGEKLGKIRFHDKNIKPVWKKWTEIPNKLRVRYYIDRFNKRKAKTIQMNKKV